ncbi:MAG: hypothetical protein RIF33_08095 [Cyclobacteriaceae bacterium]
MKKHCVLALLLSCWVFTSLKPLDTQRAEAVIAFESFEGTASELGYTVDNWRDGFSDYFDRVSNVNSGNPAPDAGYHIFSGVPSNIDDDGTGDQYFFGADDLDDDGNPRVDDLGVITFNTIDIVGQTNLKLVVALTQGRSSRFETDDYLRIYYALDGDIDAHPGTSSSFAVNSYTLLSEFKGSGLSTDLSEDGLGATVLSTGSFDDYTFSIPATGSSLSIRIVVDTDGGDEEVLIDNMRITADAPGAPTSATIAATAFLEGAYNGSGMRTTINAYIPLTQPYSINGHTGGSAASIPSGAVDWVLVELREAGTAATANNASKVGSTAGFLMSNGSIKATNGTSDLTISLSGNTGADFYVVVYHRNHLPIMSANAISASGGVYTIDFTSNSANTYQGGTSLATLSGGKFGMIAGDQNSDGQVNSTDLTDWRDQNGDPYSYAGSTADFNLDGQVNAVDRNGYQQPNSGKSSQVPTN